MNSANWLNAFRLHTNGIFLRIYIVIFQNFEYTTMKNRCYTNYFYKRAQKHGFDIARCILIHHISLYVLLTEWSCDRESCFSYLFSIIHRKEIDEQLSEILG